MISDTGVLIEADFELSGDGFNFSLVLKADGGSGEKRLNRDYGIAFETLMKRLSSIGASLDAAYLDSRPAKSIELEDRRLGPSKKTLLHSENIHQLCSHIRRDAAAYNIPGLRQSSHSATKTGGNQTRRVLLKISTPIAYSISTLRDILETGAIDIDLSEMQKVEGEIATPFARWLEMLQSGEQIGKDTWYFASHDIRVKIGPKKIDSIPLIKFAQGKNGKDWIVEINPPRDPGKDDGLSAIALDRLNRHWLLRQGVLHRNALSERIEGDKFANLTLLKNVHLNGSARTWYPVELLDIGTQVPIGTLEFVTRCAIARSGQIDLTEGDVELFGAAEIANSYTIPASSNPEREVRRMQGEVWDALHALTHDKRGKLTKPRHAKGYEVDGLLEIENKSLLIEIKTNISAADIYTGLGQLVIYSKILPRLAEADKILLLPRSLTGPLYDAVSSEGIKILTYNLDPETPTKVTWPDKTLEALGLL